MELFLHIGYPKTATTWWQSSVFTQHSQIGLIGTKEKYSDWGVHLITAHDFDFNSDFVRQGVLDTANALKKDTIIISWEHLLGDSAFGADHQIRNMQRLYKCFPEAKIILFIREQFSMAESLYKQYVQEGGVWSYNAFTQAQYPYRNFFAPAYLNYYQTIKHYEALFGADNVYIGLFEVVKNAPEQSIRDLYNWMGVDSSRLTHSKSEVRQNVSLSNASIRLFRFLNYFLPSRFNGRGPVPYKRTPLLFAVVRTLLQRYLDPNLIRPLTSQFTSKLQLPPHIYETWQAYFAQANLDLMIEYQLPLADYGYQLPKDQKL